jgi:hypothetical protein
MAPNRVRPCTASVRQLLSKSTPRITKRSFVRPLSPPPRRARVSRRRARGLPVVGRAAPLPEAAPSPPPQHARARPETVPGQTETRGPGPRGGRGGPGRRRWRRRCRKRSPAGARARTHTHAQEKKEISYISNRQRRTRKEGTFLCVGVGGDLTHAARTRNCRVCPP